MRWRRWADGMAIRLVVAGCTAQACGFRDVWQEFGALNYGVYCLSADSPAAQTKWQTKVG
jgi:peroxiredoxin